MLIYIRIAASLPKKTVRDVAHHLRYMQVRPRSVSSCPLWHAPVVCSCVFSSHQVLLLLLLLLVCRCRQFRVVGVVIVAGSPVPYYFVFSPRTRPTSHDPFPSPCGSLLFQKERGLPVSSSSETSATYC